MRFTGKIGYLLEPGEATRFDGRPEICCPECRTVASLENHRIEGPDEAPTFFPSLECPACGYHYFVRGGNIQGA